MDKYTFDAIDSLVNYLYDRERKDWEANGRPTKNHIFNDIDLVACWLDDQIKNKQK